MPENTKGISHKNSGFSTKTKDTVLFDFDGTLISTDEVVLKSFRYTLSHYGITQVPEEKLRSDFGGLLVDIMLKYKQEYGIRADLTELVECYRSYHHSIFADGIRCFDGIRELLADLKNQGYKLAVLTSRKKRTTEIGLKKFALTGFFDVVQTADDCAFAKPDARAAGVLLEKLGSHPSRAAIIGDSAYDVDCGRNSGMTAVFAAWGRTPPKGSYGADYTAKTPRDFFNFLEAHNK